MMVTANEKSFSQQSFCMVCTMADLVQASKITGLECGMTRWQQVVFSGFLPMKVWKGPTAIVPLTQTETQHLMVFWAHITKRRGAFTPLKIFGRRFISRNDISHLNSMVHSKLRTAISILILISAG